MAEHLKCCGKKFESFQALSLHHKKSKCGGEIEVKKLLEFLHFKERKSQKEIADILNVTKSTINRKFKEFDIKTKRFKAWNSGLKGAQTAWNKGLTKKDPRVKRYIDSGAETKKSKHKSFNISKLNKIARRLPEYISWRDKVFERDEYRSVISGRKGVLNAHHKIKFSNLIVREIINNSTLRESNDYNEVVRELSNSKVLWDINNGVTVLESEHKDIHRLHTNDGIAIITGVEGQDGSYLAEYLIELGYQVVGVTKRSGIHNLSLNLNGLIDIDDFIIEYGDITDPFFVNLLIQKYKPEMYFNLAAMSHVGQSFKEPIKVFNTNSTAVLNALEAIRQNSRYTRFYQASTSEIFGGLNCPELGYNENAKIHPRSPYGVAKAAAYHAVINYREAYGLHASNGILFNHSSPRRGYDFATRKMTRGVARIKLGMQDTLKMGNLEAVRDEGHAYDYVRAMFLMLQQEEADDYVIATGKNASIKQMLQHICKIANLKFEDVYEMDERFMRPSDVPFLLGDATKAREELGWIPEYDWKKLLTEMYQNDYAEISSDEE